MVPRVIPYVFYSQTLTATSITSVDVNTIAGANIAILAVDAGLTTVNSTRASLGAIQNRFEATIANIQTTNAIAIKRRIYFIHHSIR